MRIVEIEGEGARAAIAPAAGGRLMRLDVPDGGGRTQILRAPEDPRRAVEEPLAWGSYPMLPWPNRIAEGAFSFEGRTHRVPPNHEGNAIHGVIFDRACDVIEATSSACTLRCAFDARWPFAGHGVISYALRDGALQQFIEVHSDGDRFPAGAGWHAWFRRDVHPGTLPRVRVDAIERYELRAMIPTGAIVPAFGATDLRAFPEISQQQLDDCYLDVLDPLRIRWGDLELTMESSENARYAVVYTQSTDGICVEPQTCAIDVFNLSVRGAKHGMAIVEPGTPLIARTTWRWHAGDGD